MTKMAFIVSYTVLCTLNVTVICKVKLPFCQKSLVTSRIYIFYYIIGSTGFCPQRLATLLLSQLLYDYMNYGFILTLPVLVLFFCVVSEMWFMIEPICFGLEEQDQEFLIYSM